jgi:hypothetical protein
MQQLYEEYKILFLKQIRLNSLTKSIYETLLFKYKHIKPAKESYFDILKQICNKYGQDIEFIKPKDILIEIKKNHINGCDENVLIESKNRIIAISGTGDFHEEKSMILASLVF